MEYLIPVLSFVAGGLCAAWRLRGSRSMRQVVADVLSGGPRPGTPR